MAYATPVAAVERNNSIDVIKPASAVFDGFTVPSGGAVDRRRVLLTVQKTASENGVWIFRGKFTPMSRPKKGDQYAHGNHFDNATLIPVRNGNTYAGTVWGIDPAKTVTVDTDDHTLTRVALPAVQCRVATTEHIGLASKVLIIDPKILYDGMMNTGAPKTLTCPVLKPFTSADVGKPIRVNGAGIAGADLVTSIAKYTSASVVTLTAGCSTSVTARLKDGVMSASSTTLTSASHHFLLTDEGATIVVTGAGAGGADLVTTIAHYTSSSVVDLTTGCVKSVAAAIVQYGFPATVRYSVALHGDGLAGSDLVLVKNQATATIAHPTPAPKENGVYWANTGGAMARCTEPLVPSRVVHVSEGEANGHKRYGLATQGAVVPDTTGLNFSSQEPTFNVDDYGAIPDWDGATGTDNLAAFNATLAAAKADLGLANGNKTATIIANGLYYLSGTLDIQQTIHLQGQGTHAPTLYFGQGAGAPGAWLVFPANTTGIRIHSTQRDDAGTNERRWGLAFLTQSGTTTTLTGGSDFTPSLIGRTITISNSSTPANNGSFAITSAIDSTSLSWTNAAGVTDHGTLNGSTASLSQTGDMSTLTGGAGLGAVTRGSNILISGAATAANRGMFAVLGAAGSGTSVYWGNEGVVSGTNDANNGAISYGVAEVAYTLGGGFGDGSQATIRDLTISCKDDIDPVHNNTGHGVHATAPFAMENVAIQNFALDGVFVNGASGNDTDGTADGSMLINIVAGACGRDGFHIQGGDAAGITVLNCNATGNRRYGFYDNSRVNAYVACIGYNNAAKGLQFPVPTEPPLWGAAWGSNYHTEGSSPAAPAYNSSTFVGCYNEGNVIGDGRENRLYGDVNVLGGSLGGPYVYSGSTAFVMTAGTATLKPFIYSNTRATTAVQIEIGQQDDLCGLLNFQIPNMPDAKCIRYDERSGWWGLDSGQSHYQSVFRFPTAASAPRRLGMLFENGIFYGAAASLGDPTASRAITNHIGGTAIPPGGTWEIGDVVWNSDAVPGGLVGWICTVAGTQDPALVAVTGTIDPLVGLNILTLKPLPGSLAQWQYVTVGGSLLQIISDPGHPPAPLVANQMYIRWVRPSAGGAIGPGAAVDFSPATFLSFGSAVSRGTTDFDVTVSTLLDDTTASAETIRLGGAPGGAVTLAFATLRDGSSFRFLNGTGQTITVSGAGGGSAVPLLTGLSQRMYIEDAGLGVINVRAEAPAI